MEESQTEFGGSERRLERNEIEREEEESLSGRRRHVDNLEMENAETLEYMYNVE